MHLKVPAQHPEPAYSPTLREARGFGRYSLGPKATESSQHSDCERVCSQKFVKVSAHMLVNSTLYNQHEKELFLEHENGQRKLLFFLFARNHGNGRDG